MGVQLYPCLYYGAFTLKHNSPTCKNTHER